MKQISYYIILFVLLGIMACNNPTNKRAVSLNELDRVKTEDHKTIEQLATAMERLTATELTDLAGMHDIESIQLYMRNLSDNFIAAKKGEFYSTYQITIQDTSGQEISIPASTFYVEINPQASWRAAHTVHTKKLADSLLQEFAELGFTFQEEGYFLGLKSKQYRYQSKQFPTMNLYVTTSFHPWYMKGLYEKKVTWPCYTFEVYKER